MIEQIYVVIDKWSAKIVADIENEWGKLPIEGRANSGHLVTMTGDIIVSEIFGEGQRAWICEYGSGSRMEKTYDANPYLWDYEKSNLWNPARTGYSVRGRPEGEYQDIDGNIHYSSGKMKGLNLETDGYFVPQEPMHIIKNAVEFALPSIVEEISEVLSDYVVGVFEKNIPRQIIL